MADKKYYFKIYLKPDIDISNIAGQPNVNSYTGTISDNAYGFDISKKVLDLNISETLH